MHCGFTWGTSKANLGSFTIGHNACYSALSRASLSVPRWDDGHTTLSDRILDESYVGLTGLETTLQAEELLGTASSHVDGVITVQVGDVIRSVDVEPLSRLLQFLQRGGRQ